MIRKIDKTFQRFSKNEYMFWVTYLFDDEDQTDPDIFKVLEAKYIYWKPIREHHHKGRKWNSINNYMLNKRQFRQYVNELEKENERISE